jgi:hypothetical protein
LTADVVAVAVVAEAWLQEEVEAIVLFATMAGAEGVVQESIAVQEAPEQGRFASGQVRVAEMAVQRQEQVPPRRGLQQIVVVVAAASEAAVVAAAVSEEVRCSLREPMQQGTEGQQRVRQGPLQQGWSILIRFE